MITAISIDDEPGALDIISIHASKITDVEIVDSFTDPERALEFLANNPLDLIFLDINMPGISGLELLNRLNYTPFVIFTTAYSEYAIESYDYDAVDYLLKPIEFDRFYKAVQKVRKVIQLNSLQRDNLLSKYIFVKDGYKQVKLNIEDILYIQGEGNYLKIVSTSENTMVRMTFRQIMERLPKEIFHRTHNTYIINLCHVDKIEDNHVSIKTDKIPVSQKYRDQLLKQINQV
jgi:DNA-binding LytR/AlgR family response regulator